MAAAEFRFVLGGVVEKQMIKMENKSVYKRHKTERHDGGCIQ